MVVRREVVAAEEGRPSLVPASEEAAGEVVVQTWRVSVARRLLIVTFALGLVPLAYSQQPCTKRERLVRESQATSKVVCG